VRRYVLKLVEPAGLLLALPVLVGWRLRLFTYYTAGQLLSLIPGDVGMLIRRGWYRLTLGSCGKQLTVEFGSVIHKPEARVGDCCYIGENNRIGLVDIGDDFMSANNVSIISGSRPHGFERRDLPIRLQPTHYERVTIGRDVWIGVGAVVSADVAPHSVVGAGAVVTKTFGEWQILGGVPAAPIAERPTA
jgi:acetyltransferase-like isoleucine patch superfamily enzyme